MKNSKKITEYLDECAKRQRLLRSDDLADLDEYDQCVRDNRSGQLHAELLADGWTMEEIDAAYGRRFNVDVKALRKQHARSRA